MRLFLIKLARIMVSSNNANSVSLGYGIESLSLKIDNLFLLAPVDFNSVYNAIYVDKNVDYILTKNGENIFRYKATQPYGSVEFYSRFELQNYSYE